MKKKIEPPKAVRADGWINVLTGLGAAGRDKRLASVAVPETFNQQTLEDLYRADDIAQKMVDRIPKEMFRAGYEIKAKTPKIQEGIREYMGRLNADESFRQAIKWARLHGGVGVILGVNDGRQAYEPVDWKGIKSIDWMAVLDRWQLQWRTIQTDLTKPGFGLPLTYQIQSVNAESAQANQEIHADRVIRFEGIEIPSRAFITNNYWGDSVLSAPFAPLQNFNGAFDSAGHIMHDFLQRVFEMENLTDLLASGEDGLVQQRMQLLDMTRSVVRAIVIQKGESFKQDAANLSGIPEMLKAISNRLVAASGMPHTVLLGEGSEGQTTGRSEETDFYNSISHEQETYLKPKQLKLIEYILAAKDGPKAEIKSINIAYNPLWQMDDAEEAGIYKTKAEADSLYLQNGVVDPDEVAKARFSSPDSEIQIEQELRAAIPSGDLIDAPQVNGNTIQDLALNGAQVSSLLEIVTQVSMGQLPKENARNIISSAFPGIDQARISRIIDPIEAGSVQPAAPLPARADAATTVQSVILSKSEFADPSKAAAWIAAHNFSNSGIDETPENYRFRQRPPEEFEDGSFRTIELRPGVSTVIGIPRDTSEDDGMDLADAAPAGVDTVPPVAAQENARQALEYRRKHRRGMTPVGVARARDLSNAAALSRETIARMSAFERHRQNYRPGESEPDSGPTAGTIAWLGWGGNEGIEWAQKKLREIDG
jgi:phage-related protein (TIGR01555 family)